MRAVFPDTYIVEHIRYSRGGSDEDETACATFEEARTLAMDWFCHYGGRVWINNQEYTRKELAI